MIKVEAGLPPVEPPLNGGPTTYRESTGIRTLFPGLRGQCISDYALDSREDNDTITRALHSIKELSNPLCGRCGDRTRYLLGVNEMLRPSKLPAH